METKLIKTIFCANEQKETPQTLSAFPNGDIQATCDCGRVLRFQAGIAREDFDNLVAAHKEANQGQVSVDSINATLKALADNEVSIETAQTETPAE